MGCPVPKVTKTGAGAALIKDPDTAVAVAKAAREGSGLPVTVKLRAGQKPGGVEGLEVAQRLVDEAGVAGITFHPRSAAVRHKGTPDYDLAAELVRGAARAGDRLRRDGGRRAHPLGVRAHGLRGGHAGAWRTRKPVAVRAGAGRARRGADAPRRSSREWHWVIDRAEEHLGPGAGRALPAEVPSRGTSSGSARRRRFRTRCSGRKLWTNSARFCCYPARPLRLSRRSPPVRLTSGPFPSSAPQKD